MKLLVLDRDGVINHDSPDYIKSPEEWLPIPGSLEAISQLTRAGWTIVVATNQSGVARGLYDVATLNRIHARMHRKVGQAGGHIAAIFFCPHGPEHGCNCRKPAPGMLEDIQRRYSVPASQLVMVGDSLRDLQAVAAVGGRPILVRTGNGRNTEQKGDLPVGTLVFDDLAAVAAALLLD
ncbi:D-glycero-beta-D-manno-heptose 1,7-bisphosphate 7-phosphatase [Chitinilyticum piscinae]|uniref:D,D-heptose 1,7-bisphosphate phosphatase n=1 Tax=Chitinilyticum piscinae TaxID=2866724 RepID=A0A8J7FK34_9NEIS|nr:D-glycero-beta-D-manno-heptose 1,7-bisphosphate 7-phosphatase [Chitinilyticum piscinae]MBE9609072.1 D-glycero-beta-D-manno-heptose 1,7-bisphosphate 7-phosphatase [Chitinilyticum piscinae]